MVTKCVTACIVSSTLASVVVPGSPLVTLGHPKSVVEDEAQGLRNAQPVPVSSSGATVRPTDAPISAVRRSLGEFKMTAYTRYAKSSRRTATGTLPTVGRTVAVDPRVIPFGTRIHIEGIGVRIAEDAGKGIKGKKLDLYLPSVQSCTRFGARSRRVYVLDQSDVPSIHFPHIE